MYDVTPYEVLGVPRTAAAKQIRTAWLVLSRTNHPDKDTNVSAVAIVSVTPNINPNY
jgi:curved DNA-binding protein CbpA